jgi:putative heme iron utilization protein
MMKKTSNITHHKRRKYQKIAISEDMGSNEKMILQKQISPSYVRFCQERICETLCTKKRNYLNEQSYYPVYKTFKIENQRELTEYLETKIERKPDGTLE